MSNEIRTGSAAEEKKPHILIADDDPGVVRALSARCRSLGIEVTTATDGVQAILKAKQMQPDLLIVDINMPEADGFKVCEWLLDPSRPSIDVIVMTGNDDVETYDRCDAIGAHYVRKSSETWEVVRTILIEVLRLQVDSNPRLSRQLSMPQKIHLPAAGPRVLIVDDDPGIVKALETRLRKLGINVFVAYDGMAAYRIASREQPNLVIADYMMPKGGGHYLIWRLRDEPATANTPIFIITGQTMSGDGDGLRDEELTGPHGANRVFHKPIDNEMLLAAVRNVLDLASAEPTVAAQ